MKKTVSQSKSTIMKEKTIKTIKGISIAIMILMMAVTVMDLYFWIERWQNVNWIEEHIGWQKSIIICYIVSTLMLTAAVICFIINIMKGLKKGIIFNRINTYVIYASAIIFFLYSFMQSTVDDVFKGVYVWSINTNMLICPLLIIILGLLHKLAVEASEENNLTI